LIVGSLPPLSFRHGAVHNEAGLDVPSLLRHVRAKPPFGGSLRSFPGGAPLPLAELLPLECDVLIPAAVGGVINDRTARSIKATAVVEAANAATTPAGDAVLRDRGVECLPDILGSGGGVAVSYFEWILNQQQYRWSDDEIARRLDAAMTGACRRVFDAAKERGLGLRTAAFVVGLQSVTQATMNRGFD
jgi:glutamate dehydrogenase (NAD(P)+)